jgi:UDP-2,3-diacylglucosamine pyrophosphatase LpxH
MTRRKAYFLSDLHLFANRSFAESIQPRIHQSARESHTLILGGDIFDFRWSRWQDHAKTLEESVRWLRELLAVNPECRVHYLLGNHDASQAFTAELEDLSRAYANLEWHPHLMRLDDKVFLHGDIIDAKIPLAEGFHEQLDLLRRRKDERALPTDFRHKVYDAVVKTHVHRLVATVANPKTKVLTRVSDYLDWAGHGSSTGIRDVYFGHTHCPLESEPYAGMRFHNPGASIKGLRFRMIEVALPSERKG